MAGIVGCGKALEMVSLEKDRERAKYLKLSKLLIEGVTQNLEGVTVNGHPYERLANNVHFTFNDIDGEALVLNLSTYGIATSTGSACSTGSLEPSHVLEFIGMPREESWGSLRLTMGKDNTEREIEKVVKCIVESVNKLRRLTTK